MTNSFRWDEKIAEGRVHSTRVYQWLLGLPTVKQVDHHEDDRKARGEGWDFLIKYEDERPDERVEVKSDNRMHETGNLFCEVSVGKHPGCFLHSEAKSWLFYDTVRDTVYWFPYQELHDMVMAIPNCKTGWCWTEMPWGCKEKSVGRLVKVDRVLKTVGGHVLPEVWHTASGLKAYLEAQSGGKVLP